MSYIQIEKDGRKYGLKFNNFAFRAASKKLIPNMIEETIDYAFFWGGLVGNAYAKGLDVSEKSYHDGEEITFENTVDLFDSLTDEQKEAISECLSSTQQYQKLIKAGEGAEEEKKTMTNTGETLSASPSVS